MQEGGFTLKTRVIEPDELYSTLELGEEVTAEGEDKGDFKVKTHLVDGDWSVKVTPKNVGARGIKVPLSSIAFKPGYSEEDGNYADLEFEIFEGCAGLLVQSLQESCSNRSINGQGLSSIWLGHTFFGMKPGSTPGSLSN